MAITVAELYRHPVKGLTPEPLERVELTAQRGLPHDRRFALSFGGAPVDPDARSQWLPKAKFFTLMRHERLAQLRTSFDEATGVLTIERGGKVVARGNITEPLGRTLIEEFFAAFLGAEARGTPRLLEATGHMFGDHTDDLVSMINLASVRDLERVTRAPVDPRRFRANLHFDGAAAWEEFNWIGGVVAVGGTQLRVVSRIERCAATNVNPETAERDLNIPRSLSGGFGHMDLGVLAAVVTNGAVAVGDTLEPLT